MMTEATEHILLQEHGVIVETDFTPPPELLRSPGLLNQAINNVLTNAVQAWDSSMRLERVSKSCNIRQNVFRSVALDSWGKPGMTDSYFQVRDVR